MVEPDPVGNDLRRARRQRGLPDDAVCVICGEGDPVSLKKAKLARSIIERHHLGGEVNDGELVVVLCLTHHRQLTSDQPGAGVKLRRNAERSMPEKLISVMRGLALFFFALANSLAGWADKLGHLIDDLDAASPGWRDLATARA